MQRYCRRLWNKWHGAGFLPIACVAVQGTGGGAATAHLEPPASGLSPRPGGAVMSPTQWQEAKDSLALWARPPAAESGEGSARDTDAETLTSRSVDWGQGVTSTGAGRTIAGTENWQQAQAGGGHTVARRVCQPTTSTPPFWRSVSIPKGCWACFFFQLELPGPPVWDHQRDLGLARGRTTPNKIQPGPPENSCISLQQRSALLRFN